MTKTVRAEKVTPRMWDAITLIILGISGFYLFSRVESINPAILGDEYLYSMNSRKTEFWGTLPAGDFSNYLFNFVYSSSNICGDNFYSCAKGMNILFLLGFCVVLYWIGIKFLPRWLSGSLAISASLSPLSVYTSLFLPESMYFFFMAIVFALVLQALLTYQWQSWMAAGVAIGLASISKPHAWLSAVAILITAIIVGMSKSDIGPRRTIISVVVWLSSGVITRTILGFLLAGPQSLGLFGQYISPDTLRPLQEAAPDGEGQAAAAQGLVGAGELQGALGLFWGQLQINGFAIVSLIGLSLVGIAVGVIRESQLREGSIVGLASLLSLIWLGTILIEIVLFTGWVTGGGDDHTLRVLMRYYDFLLPILPLIAAGVFYRRVAESLQVYWRWGIALIVAAISSAAFSGFFGNLQIQIADAPWLAGLVVNSFVYESTSIALVVSLLVFAAFPRFILAPFLALSIFVSVGTGFQIQDQYRNFRAIDTAEDIAGRYLNENFDSSDFEVSVVIAPSRFEATNVTFWADSPNLRYEIVTQGQAQLWTAPAGVHIVVVLDNLQIQGDYRTRFVGDGFVVLEKNE